MKISKFEVRDLSPADLVSDQYYFDSAEFLEALAAASALIAYADGNLSEIERKSFLDSARLQPELTIFSRSEVAFEFCVQEQSFLRNPALARNAALEKIAIFAASPQAAWRIVEHSYRMMIADELLYADEIKAYRDIKKVLALDTIASPASWKLPL